MKKTYCYIIDDSKEDIDIIKHFLSKVPSLVLEGSSTDPEKGLCEVLKSNRIDVVFLDVQMEPLSGLDILPQLDRKIQVVLCTSYKKFAWDAYEEWPLDYLLKPFSFTHFLQVVRSAQAKLNFEPTIHAHDLDYSYFFVPVGAANWMEKVDFKELLFVKADGEVCTFFMTDGSQLTVGKRIKVIYAALPKNQFLRIHRSHIINLSLVKQIKFGKVAMKKSDLALDIGPTFAKELYAWWKDYRL